MSNSPVKMEEDAPGSSNNSVETEEKKPEIGDLFGETNGSNDMRSEEFDDFKAEDYNDNDDNGDEKDKPFSPEEVKSIWNYLLYEIRIPHDKKVKMVKGRVRTAAIGFWIRYKHKHKGTRDVHDYYIYYRDNSEQLHAIPCLSIEEKLDLYFALNIPVRDPDFFLKLVEQFGANIDEDGIVRSATKVKHWDVTERVRPAAPNEKTADGFKKFTEKDDGLMWGYILKRVMEVEQPDMCSVAEWNKFKKEYKEYKNRPTSSLYFRYTEVLAPNLFRMPFDIEAKAVLFHGLDLEVPAHFRNELMARTGVELARNGKILSYPNRPETIALQSRRYYGSIGISSADVLSTLKKGFDPIPYTLVEDQEMWSFINHKIRNLRGKVIRILINKKPSGRAIWNEFIRNNATHRSVESLADRFHDDLLENIMSAEIDMRTKIEILYGTNHPVNEETLQSLRTFAEIELSSLRTITYAGNRYFQLGKKATPPPEQTSETEFMKEVKKEIEDSEYRLENGKIKQLPPKLIPDSSVWQPMESPAGTKTQAQWFRGPSGYVVPPKALPPRNPIPYVSVRDRFAPIAPGIEQTPSTSSNSTPGLRGVTDLCTANRFVLVKTKDPSKTGNASSFAGISLQSWKKSNSDTVPAAPSISTPIVPTQRYPVTAALLQPVKLVPIKSLEKINEPSRLMDEVKTEPGISSPVGLKRKAVVMTPASYKMKCLENNSIPEREIKQELEEEVPEQKVELYSEPVKEEPEEEEEEEFDDSPGPSSLCFKPTVYTPGPDGIIPNEVYIEGLFKGLEGTLKEFYERVQEHSASMKVEERIPFMSRTATIAKFLQTKADEILMMPPRQTCKKID